MDDRRLLAATSRITDQRSSLRIHPASSRLQMLRTQGRRVATIVTAMLVNVGAQAGAGYSPLPAIALLALTAAVLGLVLLAYFQWTYVDVAGNNIQWRTWFASGRFSRESVASACSVDFGRWDSMRRHLYVVGREGQRLLHVNGSLWSAQALAMLSEQLRISDGPSGGHPIQWIKRDFKTFKRQSGDLLTWRQRHLAVSAGLAVIAAIVLAVIVEVVAYLASTV
jgi:hypothetical protein